MEDYDSTPYPVVVFALLMLSVLTVAIFLMALTNGGVMVRAGANCCHDYDYEL